LRPPRIPPEWAAAAELLALGIANVALILLVIVLLEAAVEFTRVVFLGRL